MVRTPPCLGSRRRAKRGSREQWDLSGINRRFRRCGLTKTDESERRRPHALLPCVRCAVDSEDGRQDHASAPRACESKEEVRGEAGIQHVGVGKSSNSLSSPVQTSPGRLHLLHTLVPQPPCWLGVGGLCVLSLIVPFGGGCRSPVPVVAFRFR